MVTFFYLMNYFSSHRRTDRRRCIRAPVHDPRWAQIIGEENRCKRSREQVIWNIPLSWGLNTDILDKLIFIFYHGFNYTVLYDLRDFIITRVPRKIGHLLLKTHQMEFPQQWQLDTNQFFPNPLKTSLDRGDNSGDHWAVVGTPQIAENIHPSGIWNTHLILNFLRQQWPDTR